MFYYITSSGICDGPVYTKGSLKAGLIEAGLGSSRLAASPVSRPSLVLDQNLKQKVPERRVEDRKAAGDRK